MLVSSVCLPRQNKYFDVTIRSGSKLVGAHRIIVSNFSSFLEEQFDETAAQLSNLTTKEMPEVSHTMLDSVVTYMYTGSKLSLELSGNFT